MALADSPALNCRLKVIPSPTAISVPAAIELSKLLVPKLTLFTFRAFLPLFSMVNWSPELTALPKLILPASQPSWLNTAISSTLPLITMLSRAASPVWLAKLVLTQRNCTFLPAYSVRSMVSLRQYFLPSIPSMLFSDRYEACFHSPSAKISNAMSLTPLPPSTFCFFSRPVSSTIRSLG